MRPRERGRNPRAATARRGFEVTPTLTTLLVGAAISQTAGTVSARRADVRERATRWPCVLGSDPPVRRRRSSAQAPVSKLCPDRPVIPRQRNDVQHRGRAARARADGQCSARRGDGRRRGLAGGAERPDPRCVARGGHAPAGVDRDRSAPERRGATRDRRARGACAELDPAGRRGGLQHYPPVQLGQLLQRAGRDRGPRVAGHGQRDRGVELEPLVRRRARAGGRAGRRHERRGSNRGAGCDHRRGRRPGCDQSGV